MTTGICRNPTCPNGTSGLPVDRYPGPGEYCPECGDLLEASDAPAAAPAPPPAPMRLETAPPEAFAVNGYGLPPLAPAPAPRAPSAVTAVAEAVAVPAAPVRAPHPEPPPQPRTALPFGGLSASEALQQFALDPEPAPPPRLRPRPRLRMRLAVGSLAVLLSAAAGIVVLRPMAIGHPRAGDQIRVCRSSMTAHFAGDVVRAYSARSGVSAGTFALVGGGSCDVRFAAAADGKTADIVGHDGIVAIVNPGNPLGDLTEPQVRAIFRGLITDWSQVGGPPGPIVAMLPGEGTDEYRQLTNVLLHETRVGADVARLPSSAEVVRAVTGPNGKRAIGFVAFSAAMPGKVMRIGSAAPSLLSIAEARYPLAVPITVQASAGTPAAAGLAQFARSDAAQSIGLRDGFVPRKGI